AAARELGVEKGVEPGRGGIDAIPALVGVAHGQRKPFASRRCLAAGPRRMRGYEGGVGQELLPGAADVDQVVAVGPVAVQEHDQLLGDTRAGLETRAVEVSHSSSSFRWSSCASSWRWVSWRWASSPAARCPRGV